MKLTSKTNLNSGYYSILLRNGVQTAGHITKADIENIVIPEITDELQKEIKEIIAQIKTAVTKKNKAETTIISKREKIYQKFLQ